MKIGVTGSDHICGRIQKTLEKIGISNARVLVAHGFSPDQDDFQNALTDFHRYNYYHNGAKICFTNMEKTYEMLSAENIPCIRISVSEDVILEQVYHIQFLENTARQNRGQNMSSRPVLMREFIQNGEYQKILFHGQQTPHNRLWIGIGYEDRQIKLVLTGDEEVAHAFSHGEAGKLIEQYAGVCEAAFNLESQDCTKSTIVLLKF